jgi:transcriptional regulator with XRE-family HTH domain
MKNFNFGGNIKALRKEKSLTVTEIAAELDIRPPLWSSFERGNYPDVATLIRIAKYFGIAETALLHTDLSEPIIRIEPALLTIVHPVAFRALTELEKRIDALEKKRTVKTGNER